MTTGLLQERTPELLQAAYARERARLLALAEADSPAGCYASPVFGEGNLNCHVLFVGEAPGAEETKLGRPFIGKAGKQLDALLELIGILREDVYITNAVKYRPVVRSERSVRNRTPGRGEREAALPLLFEEISLLRPRCIVTLGNTPLSALLQIAGAPAETIGALHGKPLTLKFCQTEADLFPLYHPASGIYNQKLIAVMEQDIRALGEHLVNAKENVTENCNPVV